jgi:hypothetical protein
MNSPGWGWSCGLFLKTIIPSCKATRLYLAEARQHPGGPGRQTRLVEVLEL